MSEGPYREGCSDPPPKLRWWERINWPTVSGTLALSFAVAFVVCVLGGTITYSTIRSSLDESDDRQRCDEICEAMDAKPLQHDVHAPHRDPVCWCARDGAAWNVSTAGGEINKMEAP